jgi:hypothetical protein
MTELLELRKYSDIDVVDIYKNFSGEKVGQTLSSVISIIIVHEYIEPYIIKFFDYLLSRN